MENSQEIMPVEIQTPINFNPEQQIADGKRAAKALMEVTKPVLINNKKYLRFEDWQTLGRFYNLTVGVEWTKKINEDNEQGFGARANVFNITGQIISSAEAQCTRAERLWMKRDDYALRSMAQTRAMAKALRNVLSWVAVLAGAEGTPAEEIPEGEPFEGNEFSKPATGEPTYEPVDDKKHPPCKGCGTDMTGEPYWKSKCLDCFGKKK